MVRVSVPSSVPVDPQLQAPIDQSLRSRRYVQCATGFGDEMRQLVLGLDAAGVMVRARPMDCVGAKVQLAPRLQSLVDQDPAECRGKATYVQGCILGSLCVVSMLLRCILVGRGFD